MPTSKKQPATEAKKRHTYLIMPGIVKKIKYIAVMEGGADSAHVEKALQNYIAAWEKKNGTIPVK